LTTRGPTPDARVVVSSSPDLARAAQRIEDLPSASDKAFDCLAGGFLRLYSRITEIESAHKALANRLALLEKRPGTAVDPLARVNGHDSRRTTNGGAPDTRGSTAASRLAHRMRSGGPQS
jgi:hypothetical protein